MHQQERGLYAVAEVVTEDYIGISQRSSSQDESSISNSDNSNQSSDPSLPHRKSTGNMRKENLLVAMRDTIVQQQENLQMLAIKNQQYRDRLAASHDRVQSLRKDHLGSMDAIIKLQFERESFEAEAVWLREELKTIRNELAKLTRSEEFRRDGTPR
jgi:hypothetical protein